jgi:hypothetical protein
LQERQRAHLAWLTLEKGGASIADNHWGVLESARHKSKREVERIVAALRPLPAARSSIRKLPVPIRPVATAELLARADHHEIDAAPKGVPTRPT